VRTIKIVTVAVAALFLLMIFQNSYSQSLAMAEAKELKSTQPAAEVSSSEEPEDFVSDSGPIQSVPGPPEELLSGSITQPREQFAITESLLMVVAFVVLMLVMIFMIPLLIVLSPLIGVFFNPDDACELSFHPPYHGPSCHSLLPLPMSQAMRSPGPYREYSTT